MLVSTIAKNSLVLEDLLKEPQLIYGLVVTPDLATHLLEINGREFHNRQINEERVDLYGRDMKDGIWRHNGETIKFDTAGVLVDGYSRLTACFMHGATFMTDARTGVDKDAIATIDTGRPRSLSNVLAMRNETTATALSQGAGWLLSYQERAIYKRRKIAKSHQEMVDFIEKHPGLRTATEHTKEIRNKRLAPPGVLVAAYYICSNSNQSRTEEFFSMLSNGVGYTQMSPIRHLRDLLMQRDKRRMTPGEAFAYILIAYNKYISGDSIRILRLPSEDNVPTVKRAAKVKGN